MRSLSLSQVASALIVSVLATSATAQPPATPPIATPATPAAPAAAAPAPPAAAPAAPATPKPAAVTTAPECPLAAGVREVPYAQAPAPLKQVFSTGRKFTMPGQAFDAANADHQRLLWVRNRGTKWVVAYEQGGDYSDIVVPYTIANELSISQGSQKFAKPATLCEIANRALGVPEQAAN
jgi:hypothetical protein